MYVQLAPSTSQAASVTKRDSNGMITLKRCKTKQWILAFFAFDLFSLLPYFILYYIEIFSCFVLWVYFLTNLYSFTLTGTSDRRQLGLLFRNKDRCDRTRHWITGVKEEDNNHFRLSTHHHGRERRRKAVVAGTSAWWGKSVCVYILPIVCEERSKGVSTPLWPPHLFCMIMIDSLARRVSCQRHCIMGMVKSMVITLVYHWMKRYVCK